MALRYCSRMDFRRLRYFVQVVDAQSFSAAAERLNVAQPALSKAIRALEDDLGVALLQRSTHGVALTAPGEQLYEHCQVILDQVNRAQHSVRVTASRPSGRVAIGMPHSVMMVLGLPLLKAVGGECPDLRLELVQDHSHLLGARLRSGRLDLAVMAAQRGTTGVAYSPLLLEDLVFAEKPRRARMTARPISFADASRRGFVLPGLGNGLRAAAEAYFRTRSLRLSVAHEVDSIGLIARCVAAGLGATMLPSGCLAADPVAAELDVRPFEGGCVRTIVLAKGEDTVLTPAVARAEELARAAVVRAALSGEWAGTQPIGQNRTT